MACLVPTNNFNIIIARCLLLLACLSFSVNNLSSQENVLDVRIGVSFRNYPLGQALDSLAKFSNMYFTYDSRILDENKIVSLQSDDFSLKTILDSLLSDSSYQYQLVKKQIIITKDSKQRSEIRPDVKKQSHYFRISGIVRDAKTGRALPYVNLGVLDKLKGTTTNAEGAFSIGLSTNNLNDTLGISFIGYENSSIAITEPKDTFLSLDLNQTFIPLQEVIIRSNDPLILIKSALDRVEQNYLQSPSNYTAFYRESVQKNKHYMIYLESVLDIYTSSYDPSRLARSNARILKSRKIYDVDRLDTVSFRLQGGIEGCMKLDIVKYPAEFLQEENFDYYNYALIDIQTYNNKPVYVIECLQKDNIRDVFQQGIIYLDVSSLALVKADLFYSERAAKRLSNQLITKRARRLSAKPTKISYQVNYRYLNGKYYLSHASGDLGFRVKSRRRFFSSNFHLKFEMAVTGIETLKVHRIPYKERLKPSVVLSKQYLEYDPGFWGNETFIQPEEDIQDAIKRINPQVLLANPED